MLLFVRVLGGGVRLRLAGRTEAGQQAGGDLQGGRRDADPRADDRPAENLCDGQGGHHSSIRRGRTPQVCASRIKPLIITLLRWFVISIKPAFCGVEQSAGLRPHRSRFRSKIIMVRFGCCTKATAPWFQPVLRSHTFLHTTGFRCHRHNRKSYLSITSSLIVCCQITRPK